MKTTKELNRRYYLHRRIRRFAKLALKLKTIYVPASYSELFSEKQKFYLTELKKSGYAIQSEIF